MINPICGLIGKDVVEMSLMTKIKKAFMRGSRKAEN